ncbi:MAG: bifunctional sterol desaturase/short chain dehydrogenase [Myxacorys chilensis ATA2-1-KO14]|jgi:hypothetical protein|nr:bifunctional sterol desaturase/short chain dehydrogenase [Myxacorys chilensis ATA2-1-KO14]
MDFNLLPTHLLIQLMLGLVSIVFADLVRDLYHLAGHYWQPLQKFHTLHHKAYRPDLTITSLETYQKAQWYNDVPEDLFMVGATAVLAYLSQGYGMWLGCLYSISFLIPAIARSQGFWLQTDLTHKPGDLIEIPSHWRVNRSYHWRHHFDQGNAYFCSNVTLLDKLIGTSLSLKGKVVAITGASGTLGQALTEELLLQGAKVVALTTNTQAELKPGIEVMHWQLGSETDLKNRLQGVDILILNHGVNVYGDCSFAAIQKSYEVNTFSTLKLAELFLETVTKSSHKALKELWINTSEAEVSPALSPLYELSKRTLGDLITLRRLDAPCIIRKLVLGPFKSDLNPHGVMSSRWIAWAIVALAKRDFRNIIVTINPLTYIALPIKELFQSLYFRLFTSSGDQR